MLGKKRLPEKVAEQSDADPLNNYGRCIVYRLILV